MAIDFMKQLDDGREIRVKFFLHWSILSGATLTLIIPLLLNVENLNEVVYSLFWIKTSIGLLVFSLSVSPFILLVISQRLLIAGTFNAEKENGKSNNQDSLTTKRILGGLTWTTVVLEFLSVFSYIAGISLLYGFLLIPILS